MEEIRMCKYIYIYNIYIALCYLKIRNSVNVRS